MRLHVAAASGNVFGYLWADDLKQCDGSFYAKMLCPRGHAFGLDGLFLMQRPERGPWHLDHWDVDGTKSFCSNGSRAALMLPGTPNSELVEAISNGEHILLRRDAEGVGIRMPEGDGFGFKALPFELDLPAAYGWIGNPQLVVRVPSVEEVDLSAFASPLRHHPALPGGTNVNVVQVLGSGEARIRSWERGVEGETLCCGTGCAVAAAWLARTEGLQTWNLHPASGEAVTLKLDSDGEFSWANLWLSGPAKRLGMIQPDPRLWGSPS
jgi:diaminopimelate epimerase